MKLIELIRVMRFKAAIRCKRKICSDIAKVLMLYSSIINEVIEGEEDELWRKISRLPILFQTLDIRALNKKYKCKVN